MEEEEYGLSLGDIFKVILKKIWWVVGATALGIILVVLLVNFWYNKNHRVYSAEYSVIYPYKDTGKYPDGSDFLVSDCITLENLTDVKNGKYSAADNKDEFKDIDVETMVTDDDITLTEVVTVDEAKNASTKYTLEVKAKYFSGEEQAANFLRTVSYFPVYRIKDILETQEYGVYFDSYDAAATYEEKVNALVSQKNYIVSSYNSLKDYGSVIEVEIAAVNNSVFSASEQKLLWDEINSKRYVLNPDKYLAEYKTTQAAIEKDIKNNENIIKALEDAREKSLSAAAGAAGEGNTVDGDIRNNAYDEEIAKYTVTNANLQNRFDEIKKTVDEIKEYTVAGTDKYKAKVALDKKLEGFRSDLEESTERLKTVSKEIYDANSRIIYTVNKVKLSGGLSIIMAALLGAAVGLILSAAVVCIIDAPKYKRAKLAAISGANPASAEAKEESSQNAENQVTDKNE